MMTQAELAAAQAAMRERAKVRRELRKRHKAPRLEGFGCKHMMGLDPCPVTRNGSCRIQAKLLHLERHYGLDYETLVSLLAAQNKRCAICKEPFTVFVASGKRKAGWVPDHCHKTGKVRALLCHACNVKIGLFHDDPVELEIAAAYLRKHGA